MRVLILTTLLFSFTAKAELLNVSIEGPFNCQNAEQNAFYYLTQQCQKLGKVLTAISYSNCAYSRDDGGYVTYYEIDAQGTCSEK